LLTLLGDFVYNLVASGGSAMAPQVDVMPSAVAGGRNSQDNVRSPIEEGEVLRMASRKTVGPSSQRYDGPIP
jgi:hypothetical protein